MAKRQARKGKGRASKEASMSGAKGSAKAHKGKRKTAAKRKRGEKKAAKKKEENVLLPREGSTITIFCRRDFNRYLHFLEERERYEALIEEREKQKRSRRSLNSLSEEEQMALLLRQSLSDK